MAATATRTGPRGLPLEWPGTAAQLPATWPLAAQPLAGDVSQMTQALLAYSLSIPDAVPSRQMALAEFDFRNGWFLGQQPTPRHVALLRQVGAPLRQAAL